MYFNTGAHIIARSEIRRLASDALVPDHSVISEFSPDMSVAHLICSLNHRTQTVIDYVDMLMLRYFDRRLAERKKFRFVTQGDDRPADVHSIAFQTRREYNNVLVIPDFYYTLSLGYQEFLMQDAGAWGDKSDQVLWRGSTTGGFGQAPETIVETARYRLCARGKSIRPLTDFRFINVVQARDEGAREAIEVMLRDQDLFGSFVDGAQYSHYKYHVQIDGNGNSWEFMKKLRLNSCMLLVDSPWILWHYQFVRAWEHYVPIRTDLSDLEEKIEWCRSHDDEAERIAGRARKLALSMDYDAELRDAAARVFYHSVYFAEPAST